MVVSRLQEAVFQLAAHCVAHFLEPGSPARILEGFARKGARETCKHRYVFPQVRQVAGVILVGVGEKNALYLHLPAERVTQVFFPYPRVLQVRPV